MIPQFGVCLIFGDPWQIVLMVLGMPTLLLSFGVVQILLDMILKI
ncbi:hypothetical protein [Moraxella catarrhalis]|nr:hypothetical protein [Moraxella catarrhalis]